MITNIVQFLSKKGLAIEQTEKFVSKMLGGSMYVLSLVEYEGESTLTNGTKIDILECHINHYQTDDRIVYTIYSILEDTLKKDDGLGYYLRDKRRTFHYCDVGTVDLCLLYTSPSPRD